MKKKWKPKFNIRPYKVPFRRVKIKKPLTKKKYHKDLVKYIIQIAACVFLLGIVFVAIFKGGF